MGSDSAPEPDGTLCSDAGPDWCDGTLKGALLPLDVAFLQVEAWKVLLVALEVTFLHVDALKVPFLALEATFLHVEAWKVPLLALEEVTLAHFDVLDTLDVLDVTLAQVDVLKALCEGPNAVCEELKALCKERAVALSWETWTGCEPWWSVRFTIGCS